MRWYLKEKGQFQRLNAKIQYQGEGTPSSPEFLRGHTLYADRLGPRPGALRDQATPPRS